MRRLTLFVAAAIAIASTTIPLVLMTAEESQEARDRQRVFRNLKPASVSNDLIVMTDSDKLLGWITGPGDFRGQQVSITHSKGTDQAEVQAGNTFVWKHDYRESGSVVVRWNAMTRHERIEPSIETRRVAFFVVDRTAYRPGQTLKFTVFVRQEAGARGFQPVANQELLVQLRGTSRSTVAARLELKTDSQGRAEGSYTFNPEDPLDTYELKANGFLGSASVKLAEFRKAKVRLEITGKREGQQLKLKFRALDFLNKPVAGSKVRFQAYVVQADKETEPEPLDASKFALTARNLQSLLLAPRTNEDERLLDEAGWFLPPSDGPRQTVVAQIQGNVPVSESGDGEWTLELEPAWTRGDYTVQVNGVLTDYNGREQRASKRLSIGGGIDSDLKITVPRRNFQMGQAIQVQVQATDKGQPVEVKASVMAMRLSPVPTANQPAFGYGGFNGYYGGLNSLMLSSQHGWNQFGGQTEVEYSRRTLITAAVVERNTATLTLHEAGAYQLVCIARLPDGRTLKNEVGCVVHKPRDMPVLLLRLDRSSYKAGEMLRGEIHCSYQNAPVLLTIRDSGGIRFWKSYQVRDAMAVIDEKLPAGLGYGCTVEVQFLESAENLHVVQRRIKVEPTDRTLDVKIASQETYGPGDNVRLALQVNRREKVDLVVSVYDESLLGIAPDLNPGIRDFFLADDRIALTARREVIRRRLKGQTAREIVKRLEQKRDQREFDTPGEKAQADQAIADYRSGRIQLPGLRLMLNTAGVEAEILPASAWGWSPWGYHFDADQEKQSPIRLAELLERHNGQWRLDYRWRANKLVLMHYHEGQIAHLRENGGAVFGMGGYGMVAANSAYSYSPSANGFFSNFAVSGQGFASHMPIGPSAGSELLDNAEFSTEIRRDFSDLAYWNGRVRTDEQGKAEVEFKLPDSLTNWRVVVTAVSSKLHVGQSDSSFRSYKPIMVWPMIPRIFTEGDRVQLYASVHNRTDRPQEITVGLEVKNGKVRNQPRRTVTVPAKSNLPVYWEFEPDEPGFTQLLMSATCAAGKDASLKRLPVAAMAAEQVVTGSGFARGEEVLTIPSGTPLKDGELELTLVPSLIDDTMQSLDYLVQYPHGCVEQTMSRFLPAIVVKETLDRAQVKNEALEEKLPGVVAAGIKRLLALQSGDGGWGWHGGGQTHEMMTPYALYGLLKAEQAGYKIPNSNAVQNGLNRLQQFIRQMGEDKKGKHTADRIYCMYVYSMKKQLDPAEWEFIEQQAAADKLSDYALAMCLEMALKTDRKTLAKSLSQRLHRRAQRAPGSAFWTSAGFSRWGDDRFEITAAVLRALVANDPDDPLIAPVLSFFVTTKRGNRWNSTKDTAMIVYAICDYLATQDAQPGGRRKLQVAVNDGELQPVVLESGSLPKLRIPASQLRHGPNQIRFVGNAPGAMYRAVYRYWERGQAIQPLSHGLTVERKFFLLDDRGNRIREVPAGGEVPRGAYLLSEVSVKSHVNQAMRYVLVENPKPANCEILPASDARFRYDSTQYALREDKTAGVAYHHEQTGPEILDHCVLHAELEGVYQVPPARVELMYETLTRGHSEPFQFRVKK